MENGKIYVIGLGPGGREQMTGRAVQALAECSCVAGYGLYLELIAGLIEGKERIETGMTREIDRCKAARDAALSGKTISVQEGTTGDFYASGDQDMTASQIADANVLRFKSGIEAGMAVASGKADAMIIDELPATKIVEAQSDALELLPTKLTDEQYAFAVNKGCEDLLEVINKVLTEKIDDGTVDSLVNQHMGV